MRIADLLVVIHELRVAQPQTDAYEAGRSLGSSRDRKAWYRHQKEHLQGWLSEYGGGGAYGRQQGSNDPRLAYNRFQCAPGLIWLAEALGEDADVVRRAITAAQAAPKRGASQCAAVRSVIPWARIEELATDRLRRSSQITDGADDAVLAAQLRRTHPLAGRRRPRP